MRPDRRIGGQEGQRSQDERAYPPEPGYGGPLFRRKIEPDHEEIVGGEQDEAGQGQSGGVLAGAGQADQYSDEQVEPGPPDGRPEQQIGYANQRGHRRIEISQPAEIDQPGAEGEAEGSGAGDDAPERDAAQPVNGDDKQCAKKDTGDTC